MKSWPTLLRLQPNVTAQGASLVMGVPADVAFRELREFRGYLVKRPTWSQLLARYPKIDEVDAAYVMGVDEDHARESLRQARRSMKKPFAVRTTGLHKIACDIVRTPLKSVKVSTAQPDPVKTQEWREREKREGYNPRKGVGALDGTLDADTIRMLPSQQIPYEPNELGKKRLDDSVEQLHIPDCLWNLSKKTTQSIKAMSLDERIEVGDLSLTKGDMAEMTRMQRELAARRQAEELAKAA
jgi:hypothetical protein